MMMGSSFWSVGDTDSLNRTVINLKVLAALRPGERLSMHDACFVVQRNRWWQPLVRWWGADTRWRTLEAVNRVVNDAIRIMQVHTRRHQQQQPAAPVAAAAASSAAVATPPPAGESLLAARTVVLSLATELTESLRGVTNLRETYLGDRTFVAHVDVLEQKVEQEVQRARDLVRQQQQQQHVVPPDPAAPLEGSDSSSSGGDDGSATSPRSSHAAPSDDY